MIYINKLNLEYNLVVIVKVPIWRNGGGYYADLDFETSSIGWSIVNENQHHGITWVDR